MPIWAVHALIPKFHLQSHEEKCHTLFSYNYQKGAVWTEGEGVEQNWYWLNPQAPSTAKMMQGHQWDTLNDWFGWLNLHKTMGLGQWSILVVQGELTFFLQAIFLLNDSSMQYLKLMKHAVTSHSLITISVLTYQRNSEIIKILKPRSCLCRHFT